MSSHVEYLFSILDYHHFNLFSDGQHVGQLIVNTVDRSIALRARDNAARIDHTPYFRSYRAFERWWKFQH